MTQSPGPSAGSSESRHGEDGLLDRREQLALFIEHAPSAIAMLDARMRYLAASQRFAQDYQVPLHDLIGRSHYEVFPDLPTHWREAHRRCLAGAVQRCQKDSLRRPDGSIDWVSWEIHPWRRRDGQIGGLLLSCEVITERVRSEEELERQAAKLRAAARQKDVFLAALSHELRNPLTPVRAAADLLVNPKLDPQQLRWAREVIRRQVAHMAHLLDDLFDVARITQGKLLLKRQRVELTELIDSALEGAGPLLKRKQHQLNVSFPTDPVALYADPVRLAQVFSNLLTNAAKYTDPGGRIELGVRLAGEEVVIEVRDNGIGMTQETLAVLFEMFLQNKRAEERSEGGLGIGLALVKRLTELHGGAVEARSEGLGRGSIFTVRLPCLNPTAAEPIPNAEDSGPAKTPHMQRKILVADDNRDSVDSLALLLQFSGHEVRVAYDGPTALSIAQVFRPDCAVIDVGMPGMDGYAVAQVLRGQGWASRLKLIALTGWGQEEDRQRAREAGFHAHLTKPGSLDQIERLLV